MNDAKFEARNPDFEAITRDGFARHGLMPYPVITHGDVFVIKDDMETLCATMLQTIMVLPESESRPAG